MLNFIKRNLVFTVAFIAATVTCIIIPPDKAYLGYFDFKTLACLFLTLAVVNALRNIRFFTLTAKKIILLTGNLRTLCIALIYITFIGSMLIANDMALITFLPLGYFALKQTENEQYAPYLFILQNIAANLGGMLTPFGNPQNLYLYSYFNIPTKRFTLIMLPPFILAVVMLTICGLLVKPVKLEIKNAGGGFLPVYKTVIYALLFALTILIVFRIIPYYIGLIIVTAVLLIIDRNALKAVDYPLLLTFALFFIFSGNMARIDAVNRFASFLLEKSALLTSAAFCQIISNVPTAILLSKFTSNYKELLLGVNIGGTGTLISSLASLITFNTFRKNYPEKTKQYLKLFVLLNIIFLGVMLTSAFFFFR